MLLSVILFAASLRAQSATASHSGIEFDLSADAYQYRSDRAPGKNDPESWILLADYANQSLDHKLDPSTGPMRQVLSALLWDEVRHLRRVTLHWKGGERAPSPSDLTLLYADSNGPGIHTWWNRQSPFKAVSGRQISPDGLSVEFDTPIDTYGLVVRVEDESAKRYDVPDVEVEGDGVFKQFDVGVEFGPSAHRDDFDSLAVKVYGGKAFNLRAINGEKRADGQRYAKAFTLIYQGAPFHPQEWPMDSKAEDVDRTLVTLTTKFGSFTFLAADLEATQIDATESGFFIRAVGGLANRRGNVRSRLRDGQTIREMTREHSEETWMDAVRALHPTGPIPPIPTPEFLPRMRIDVPSPELVAQWNLGAWHLMRRAKQIDGHWRFNDYPFAILASEDYLILHTLDLLGLKNQAADGFDQWLELPLYRPRPAGLFSDGFGAFSHAMNYVTGIGAGNFPEDAGGGMDGVHAMGPGAIAYSMVEHFKLTGDMDWLRRAYKRMEANADWIVRQRRMLEENIPGGNRLKCAGLLPPQQVTPDSTGMLMQYYETEAYYLAAVEGTAEIVSLVDPAEGKRLAKEGAEYRADLTRAVTNSIAESPLTEVRDGTYRSFIPFACYVRGFASAGWNWARPGSHDHVNGLYWDTVQNAEPLLSAAHLLPIRSPQVQGFLDVLEDCLLSTNNRLGRRTPGYDPYRDWFAHAGWQYQCGLERQASLHLLDDDAPCFIRTTFNQYAADIQLGEYTFREHTTTGPPDKSFEESAFLERVRGMLVDEVDGDLWLCRAAPREWLEDGKQLSAKNAPTYYGDLSFEEDSHLADNRVIATVDMPSRIGTHVVTIRFRTPGARRITAVRVNGAHYSDYDPKLEIVRLHGLTGRVTIEVTY